jgi:cytochrome P450
LAAGNVVVVTAYADGEAVLRSPDFAQIAEAERGKVPRLAGALLTLDGHPHRDRRRLESALFRGRLLNEYMDRAVGPATIATLEGLARNRQPAGPVRGDLREVVRGALVRLAALLIGLDGVRSDADIETVRTCAEAIAAGRAAEWRTDSTSPTLRAAEAATALYLDAYVRPAIARRREGRRADDLLSLLVASPSGEDQETIEREACLFLTASMNTTTASLPNVVEALCRWLLEHPEDRGRLDDTEFLRSAVCEGLRLYPTSLTLLRRSLRPCRLPDGRELAAGDHLAVDVMAANRDVRVFGPDAAAFNPHRDSGAARPYGLTFGHGVHVCIGRELTTGSLSGSADGCVGTMVYLLKALFAAGLDLDPRSMPALQQGTQQRKHVSFPILLRNL